ncbi:MbtH family NRPS accessory protein [Streptomyces sp. SID14478]|uniref:MbtH family NRPS accessory protein n=1 Tax=Streptomyces sp. SID14478 TaxID=2706073 RepID=UPI0013DE9011|nr:MbtH family NRPS accessory protein [Streptomyces sp. SID14478]
MSVSTNRFEHHVVVINEEEQYSIWPEGKAIPAGWRAVGEPAPKEQCLEYIETHWTDMRPLSLRRALADDRQPAGASAPPSQEEIPAHGR